MLINNAGVLDKDMDRTIFKAQDYDEMMQMYNVNSLGPLRMTEVFLPLLKQSQLKRLCYISSEAGCLSRNARASWYGYTMSKVALNMAVSTIFNTLRPEGFTFRLYYPGWMQTYMRGEKDMNASFSAQEGAENALNYFLNDIPDEDRLVMRDFENNEWPW